MELEATAVSVTSLINETEFVLRDINSNTWNTENDMGRVCRVRGGGCMEGFGEKSRRKETSRKTQALPFYSRSLLSFFPIYV